MLKMKLLLFGALFTTYLVASCEAKYEHQLSRRDTIADPGCGLDSSLRSIIDGSPSDRDEHRWIALLEYETDRGPQYACSGVLLNSRYVLTAAHCLTNPKRKLTHVHLGELDLQATVPCFSNPNHENCKEITVTGVEKTIPHERYISNDDNSQSNSYNIGLIKLDRPVNHFQTMCLRSSNATRTGTYVTHGWGVSDFEYTRYSVRRGTTKLKSLDRKKCALEHQKTALKDDLSCVQADNVKLACIADSGGPLIVHYRDQIYGYLNMVAGVIHPIDDSCRNNSNKPIIYTDVTHYFDWIQSKMVL